ncbi:hypothetical protein PIB30_017984 [Stylosanthes scabra]|uniref:Uncharacterized protein n=1 Tax=Stylosanthes scabra TaxID=79078 RepID=A0ABU6U7Q4_9FABA|nr:hypothetical protein [Stylosanthes scabra]
MEDQGNESEVQRRMEVRVEVEETEKQDQMERAKEMTMDRMRSKGEPFLLGWDVGPNSSGSKTATHLDERRMNDLVSDTPLCPSRSNAVGPCSVQLQKSQSMPNLLVEYLEKGCEEGSVSGPVEPPGFEKFVRIVDSQIPNHTTIGNNCHTENLEKKITKPKHKKVREGKEVEKGKKKKSKIRSEKRSTEKIGDRICEVHEADGD